MPSKFDDLWAGFLSIALDWSGSCTRYDAKTREGKLAKSLRSLKPINDDKTIVKHIFTYTLEDGSVVERGPWEIRKDAINEDGFYHPAMSNGRAVLHSDGSGASYAKEISNLMVEMYLRNVNLRCSIVVVYDESKQLARFSVFREEILGSNTDFWSSSTELADSWQIPEEDFVGVEKELGKGLDLKVDTDCLWNKKNWEEGQSEEKSRVFFYFPDNICLCCPSDLSNASFMLRCCVLFTCGKEREIHEVTVTYTEGQYVSVKQGIYHPVKKDH